LRHFLAALGLKASTFYGWGLREDLTDKKPVPENQPRTTPLKELSAALNMTLCYNHWGGVKLSSFLARNKIFYLSPATLNRIKKRLTGLVQKKKLKLAVSYEFIDPNDTWSLDFLSFNWGHHLLYILVIIDDSSRYLLNWSITTEATSEVVRKLLCETFLIFGAPKVLKSDNGPQFREELKSFLQELAIEHYPNPVRRPSFNGKTERHNKEVRFAVEKAAQTAEVDHMVSIIGRSFHEYNYLRPHQALDGVTPYERYKGLDDAIKARIDFVKEQDLQRKASRQQRAIWIPGEPVPGYTPLKLIIPGSSQEKVKGLIVPVKSKFTRGKTIGYVRQSLHL